MAPASEVGRIEQNSSMPGFKNSLTLNVCCGLTPNSRRKADPEVLWRRVRKRSNRPLLQSADPEATLRALLEQRYPYYARADVTVVSRDGPHELAVEEIIAAIEFFLRFSPEPPLLVPSRETSAAAAGA